MVYRKRSPEYHPVVRAGTGLAIMGFFVSSCVPFNIRENSSPTLSPTQPRVTEFIPTPTPNEPVATGTQTSPQEIRAAFGGAVGAGGLSSLTRIEAVYDTPQIQSSLNQAGLAPVVGEQTRGGNRIVGQYSIHQNGERVCFPNMPDVLFNPNIPSGQDDWLEANNLIVFYGTRPSEVKYKGIGAITLDGLPENIICVNAVVNKENNVLNSPVGKVLIVLLDKDTSEIYGTLPGVYSADDDVRFEFETGNVFINNQKVWFVGDSMTELAAQLTPTPEATATPNFAELQRLKPAGVEGEVVMGENGNPQLKVKLKGFDMSGGGVVIAEYKNGNWQTMSFSVTRPSEEIWRILESRQYVNYLYEKDSGVTKNTLVYSTIKGQMLGFEYNNGNNPNNTQPEMAWILAYRGYIYKIKPDIFIVARNNGADREEYVSRNLTVQEISQTLDLIDNQIPGGSVSFNIGLFSVAEGATAEQAEALCLLYGKEFNRLCGQLVRNRNREVASTHDMDVLLNGYSYKPNQRDMNEVESWFSDNRKPGFIDGEVIKTVSAIVLNY